ncbi:MAG: hypothetical protein ACRC2T_17665 [Thermoguttaceae bacterium]
MKSSKNLFAIIIGVLFACQLCLSAESQKQGVDSNQEQRDLFSDTWVGTDALGRKMPTHAEVGDVKNDQRRVVGIFYITWHTQDYANVKSPYTGDVTKILAQSPEARLDAKHPNWQYSMYHWGEPETGYFLSQDEYVIRKDMSMLADAGVDVLILDVTNAVMYWDEWEVLFSTMQKMKAEGTKIPQFCFWSFNGPAITIVQNLYDRIYKEGKYKDLWFYWDEKPLILYNGNPSVDSTGNTAIKHPNPHYDAAAKTDPNNPHFGDPDYCEEFYTDYTKEVKDFFTCRTMWWGYYNWAGKRFIGTEDNWSFGYDLGDKNVQNLSAQELISTHNGIREEAAVTPAQHPSSKIGKSWSKEHGEPELNEQDLPVAAYVPWLGKTVENPQGYGIYFQDRWEDALKTDPQFLYINDWNEWTANKFDDEANIAWMNFMGRGKDAKYYFVDQYNSEFNRCVQPMKGGYTDNYYMQMAQNIRRYKGARPLPLQKQNVKVIFNDSDATFTCWDRIGPEFRDTIGDVFHRDSKGYGGEHYTDTSGRNDIVTSKVAVDGATTYFYVETSNDMTPHTDKNWMLLFIDADQNSDTGWYGYDFCINKTVPSEAETTISVPDGNGGWKVIETLKYFVKNNKMVIEVPNRILCGERDLTETAKNSSDANVGNIEKTPENLEGFDFKWSDNPTCDVSGAITDPISFCTSGDTAPNRRFNYRFTRESQL